MVRDHNDVMGQKAAKWNIGVDIGAGPNEPDIGPKAEMSQDHVDHLSHGPNGPHDDESLE